MYKVRKRPCFRWQIKITSWSPGVAHGVKGDFYGPLSANDRIYGGGGEGPAAGIHGANLARGNTSMAPSETRLTAHHSIFAIHRTCSEENNLIILSRKIDLTFIDFMSPKSLPSLNKQFMFRLPETIHSELHDRGMFHFIGAQHSKTRAAHRSRLAHETAHTLRRKVASSGQNKTELLTAKQRENGDEKKSGKIAGGKEMEKVVRLEAARVWVAAVAQEEGGEEPKKNERRSIEVDGRKGRQKRRS
ncbi:hypothetical protein RRG08_054870 [Elysia crispata]|uniref:Uncharacterized protein n=1 Tax=Elysia crispata TaxID=231223 RepID=A0AAE1DSK9_9GAST|nr:hypothetical protein RRG08_054870 [Elysia crispata]